jgi:hypothetical protein
LWRALPKRIPSHSNQPAKAFQGARDPERLFSFYQLYAEGLEAARPPAWQYDEKKPCGWIMKGLLEKAGFRMQTAEYPDEFLAAYLCTRKDA